MDYSAVSQAVKRLEQESKVNHEMGEIKQKIKAALRDNWMPNAETGTYKFSFIKLALNDNTAITAKKKLSINNKNLKYSKKKRIFKDFIEY